MGKLHVWKTRTDDGRRREVRAQLFGGAWTLQAKLDDEDEWTTYAEPPLDDLIALRNALADKYRRGRVPREHLSALERAIRARGGSWED